MKKSASALVLLLLFSVIVISSSQIGIVNAEDTIYIRADGSVEGTDKILRNGNVYTFLENISIDDSGVDGIIIEKDNIVIDGADYTLQITGAMESSRGVKVTDLTNVTIKNLRILDFNYGIQLQRSSNNTILGNYIYPIGLNLRGAHNNSIIENNLSGGDWGVGIMIDNFDNDGNSSGNHILGNTITDQDVGINSLIGSANIISSNNITSCKTYGIFLESYPNAIIGNNFENNTVGILFGGGASNNTIYHNNFINNQKDMDDYHSLAPWLYNPSENIWDNGFEGNYWSDYNGTDNDGNGIGDNPHFIYENNQDSYPLMEPYTVPENPTLLPLPYAPFELFPEPNSVNVPLDSNISISISRPPSIVNMSISPEVEVKQRVDEVIFYSGRYTFILSELLEPNTTYTVTIVFGDYGAPEGFAPTSIKTWNFTTSAEGGMGKPIVKVTLVASLILIAIIVLYYTRRKKKVKGNAK